MSFCDCIASSRALPVGNFRVPYVAVFDSYRIFASSEYYIPSDRRILRPGMLSPEKSRALEARAMEEGSKVVVCRSIFDSCTRILSFGCTLPSGDPAQLRSMEENASRFLTLPCRYHAQLSLDYLSKYLQPGEEIEIYCSWSGDASGHEAGNPEIMHVCLQDILDGKLDPEDSLWKESHHLIYLTAASTASSVAFEQDAVPEPAARVYLDDHAIFIRNENGSYIQI